MRGNDFRGGRSPYRNTLTFMVFLVLAVLGGLIGSLMGGEAGARVGFVVMGLSALILPYRKWLAQIFSAYRDKS